jgi:hypothetical protein
MATADGLRRAMPGLSEAAFRERFGTEEACRTALFERHRQLVGRGSRRAGVLPILRGNRDVGDLGPDREGSRAGASVLGGGDVIATEVEEVVDLVVRGEEPLCLTG